MSLRDFNAPSSDALHNVPLGNGGGLNAFHTKQPEDIAPNNTPKIIGALVVVLMIGAAGAALYVSAGKSTQPKPVVAASNLPAPPPPAPAAMTPAPDANTPAAAPIAAPSAAPVAPVKTASVPRRHAARSPSTDTASTASSDAVSARMAADSSQASNQPQQQAAVAAPTPSPSDVATNTPSNVPAEQHGAAGAVIDAAGQQCCSGAGPADRRHTGTSPVGRSGQSIVWFVVRETPRSGLCRGAAFLHRSVSVSWSDHSRSVSVSWSDHS
jgi:hypothetical protein